MTSLYTARAAAEAGEELHAVIAWRAAVKPELYPELHADGMTVLARDGHLATPGGRAVAAVRSVYVPGRIPPYAARLLARTVTPLGLALEPYGAYREELEAAGKWTRGLLYLPGCALPAAMAWELTL